MALPAILLSMIPDLIGKGFDLFDKKFQTDAEKETAVRNWETVVRDKIQGAWDTEQKHITDRHKADMRSDSWLSKNIRPMTLVYLMALFTIAFFTDVDLEVLSLLKQLMMTVFVFYFGSRTLDKFTSTMGKK